MELKVINYAPSDNNTYILNDQGHAIIIDPSTTDGRIESYVKVYMVDMILLTHGHYDHFSDVNGLHRRYPTMPIYMNSLDNPLAAGDPPLFGNRNQNILDTSILTDLNEGELAWLDHTIYVYHMPGHSPGSLVYLVDHYLFSGDVLFDDSIGRDDLPLGNGMDLRKSLKRFEMFDDSTIVFPGHGPSSTMADQWASNPYLGFIHHRH